MNSEVSTVTDCGTLMSGVSVFVAVEMRVAMYPIVTPPPARCSTGPADAGTETGGCGGAGTGARRAGAARAGAGRGALVFTVTVGRRVIGAASVPAGGVGWAAG